MKNGRGKKRSADDDSHAQGGPPRAKRLRVSQACNECRKKKERCDGVQPQCGPCSSTNRICCFDAQTRRRGLPTGYVRAVEIFLGLMFHSIDGIENRATAILRGERGLPVWQVDQSSPSLVNNLADSWRRSGTMKELEQLLAGIDSGDDNELSTRDLYERLERAFMSRLKVDDGCDTRVALLSPPQTNTPPPLEQFEGDIAGGNDNAAPSLLIANTTSLVQESREPMDLPHEWAHLLDRYFTDTHTWFPIASKHDVLRQAFHLANNNSEAEGQECMISKGDRAALFATLAYASYRDTLSSRGRPEQLQYPFDSPESLQHESPSISLTKRLQSEAMSIVNQGNEDIEHDLGHVQALLTLTILHVNQGYLTQAWITIGQAVHIAVILKIIPSTQRNTQSGVGDKQRRLFLGIYVLETLIAYTLEQRPYLRALDLEKIGLLPVDSIEEWETWRPFDSNGSNRGGRAHTPGRSLSAFNALVRLITLLNDQAHGVSSLEETLESFRLWNITQPSASQIALDSIEITSIDTPPQIINLISASLCIGALLQIKSFLAQERGPGPASLSTIPVSAREPLEAIMRHRRLVMPSQTCPLMAVYMSMLESLVDFHGLSCSLDDTQQILIPAHGIASLENECRSLDFLELQTAASCTISMQPAVSSNATGDPQAFENFGDTTLDNHVSDQSLFDSLSFLDSADCSHQSGRFLENLGISSELAPFDIEALFAQ